MRYLAATVLALAATACSGGEKISCAEADRQLMESLPKTINWTPAEAEAVARARAINEEACR